MKIELASQRMLVWLIGSLAIALLAGFRAETAVADQTTNAPAAVTVVTNVQVELAAKLVTEGKVTALDVRTPTEFGEGHIGGATNIDFMAKDFSAQVAKLDRDKVYLVYCAVGGRSKRCLPQLKQLGFKHIYHFDGGFAAWEEAGKPVARK